MSVHPQNRGGIYPQPDTVRNLGVEIMAPGFNQSEANHEGVSVEEMPFCERAKHGRSGGYAEYNLKQCDHPFLENTSAP